MKRSAMVYPEATASFHELISPLSTEEFFANYWETMFLHLRKKRGPFDRYFSLREIDAWSRSTRSGVVFTLRPQGDGVLFEICQAQNLGSGAIFTNFKQGSTQILKGLADWPSLQGLIGHLGGQFHADVHVNAFLTPPGAKTHPIYLANDDIFVLQLEGEETWRLHEFSLLQLDLPQKNNLSFPNSWQNREQAPLLAEVRLQPGDLLYIPRGMPHFVDSPQQTSLNLRIYLTSLAWVDFLKFATECAALEFQELRQGLPPGFVESDELCAQMRRNFEQVMQVFQKVSFDAVLAAVKRNRVVLQGFPPDSPFGFVAQTEPITTDSLVERRADTLCTVEEIPDANRKPKCCIFFGEGRQVKGPSHILGALKFVRDHARFRVSDLPGLDDEGQLTLVRRLLSDGLLRTSQAVAERVESTG